MVTLVDFCLTHHTSQGTAAITLAAVLAAVRAVDAVSPPTSGRTSPTDAALEGGGGAAAAAGNGHAPEKAAAAGAQASGELAHHRVLFHGAGAWLGLVSLRLMRAPALACRPFVLMCVL